MLDRMPIATDPALAKLVAKPGYAQVGETRVVGKLIKREVSTWFAQETAPDGTVYAAEVRTTTPHGVLAAMGVTRPAIHGEFTEVKPSLDGYGADRSRHTLEMLGSTLVTNWETTREHADADSAGQPLEWKPVKTIVDNEAPLANLLHIVHGLSHDS